MILSYIYKVNGKRDRCVCVKKLCKLDKVLRLGHYSWFAHRHFPISMDRKCWRDGWEGAEKVERVMLDGS